MIRSSVFGAQLLGLLVEVLLRGLRLRVGQATHLALR